MQNPNQFKQTVTKGMLDLRYANAIFPMLVSSSAAANLKAGDPVNLITPEGMPTCDLPADKTEAVFGIVAYNLKQAEFKPNDIVEVAAMGSIIYVEASGAIAVGTKVALDPSTGKVAAAASGEVVVGKLLDASAADGDLVRMIVADFVAQETLA